MHEVPGQDEKCPVNSFLRYRTMLPIGCLTLWPKPLPMRSKDGQVFSKSSLGHNKLGSLMKELCVEAQLSKVYTNHSLRAPSVHLFGLCKCTNLPYYGCYWPQSRIKPENKYWLH